MADRTWAFAEDDAGVSPTETSVPADHGSESFRRWVNRRWPRRDQRESKTTAA